MPLKSHPSPALTRAEMLARSAARDAAFDGRFLTGVLSTGIYCLPSCPARKPKPENVRFFTSEDEARAAGLRPCLRCKPERFYAGSEPELERFEALRAAVRAAPGDYPDVASLGRRAALGATMLTRLFRRHAHLTPAEFLQQARLRHACQALLETDARVLDVALDSGFESSSAFHHNFQRRLRTTPQAWRALGKEPRFELALPPSFRLADALAALGRDPASVCEHVASDHFVLALRIGGEAALLEVRLGARHARCELVTGGRSSTGQRADAQLIARRVLGLCDEPAAFERAARADARLAPLVARRPGARIALWADVWEALLWAVLGQAVHLRTACARRLRLAKQCGEDAGRELRATPGPRRVADEGATRLARVGLSRAQATGLAKLAQKVADGSLALDALEEASAIRLERCLLEQAGVGPWTAQYVMMRGYGLADCVPAGDSALATALQRVHELEQRPTPDQVRRLMTAHAPHRSLSTWHLWQSLGDPA